MLDREGTKFHCLTLYQVANGSFGFLGTGYIGGSWSYPSTNGILGGTDLQPGPGACTIDLNQSKIYTSTDGTYTMQDPNSGTPWVPRTNLYLDLWTGLDTAAQATLPLNIYLSTADLVGLTATNVLVGTWQSPSVVTVGVTPATASLTASQTQQFTATVLNTGNTAVTWSLSPNSGTIGSGGLYTAPSTIASQQTVTVTATSVADTTKSASATVTLNLYPRLPTCRVRPPFPVRKSRSPAPALGRRKCPASSGSAVPLVLW